LFFKRQGTLVARRLDIDRPSLSGDPITVADPVIYGYSGVTAASVFSVSAAGFVARRMGTTGTEQLIWFDRSRKGAGHACNDESAFEFPEFSPGHGR
jgi:hypothetical protein